jgi:hypothetical protein
MTYLIGMNIWLGQIGYRTENCESFEAKTLINFNLTNFNFYVLLSFYVKIYDRLQRRAQSLLLPLDYFVNEHESSSENWADRRLLFVNEESSDTWVNFNNTMYFLNENNPNGSENYLSFVAANEETGFLHLYHYRANLNDLSQITNGKKISLIRLFDLTRVFRQ